MNQVLVLIPNKAITQTFSSTYSKQHRRKSSNNNHTRSLKARRRTRKLRGIVRRLRRHRLILVDRLGWLVVPAGAVSSAVVASRDVGLGVSAAGVDDGVATGGMHDGVHGRGGRGRVLGVFAVDGDFADGDGLGDVDLGCGVGDGRLLGGV